MKYFGKTEAPRKEKLNKALVDYGHKVHSDKRQQKLERDKQKKEREEMMEEWDDE